MLGKLLKHEWIATVRRYALFYLVLGAMTIFATVMHALPVDNFVFSIAEVAILIFYVIAVIGVIFCSTAMAVIRFYKNMVSDEGYLTFTLPAKVEELVLAKFLVAFSWQVITVVLCILSLFCVFVPGHMSLHEFSEGMSFITDQFGDGLLPVFGIMILFSMMYQILLYYLSIAVGQLFATYKVVGAVVSYCAISFVIEMVLMIIMFVVFAIIGFDEMASTSANMTTFYVISILWTIGLGVLEYFVTCHLLKKKLNLA